MKFEEACTELFRVEGGFSNNLKDRGGATKFGVTEQVARAHGYAGKMEDLSEYTAKQIAKAQYWDPLRLDEVSKLSGPIAYELFDTGYNCGISVSGRFLQSALNALNREGRDYYDVEVDGLIGPLTVQALRVYLLKRSHDGELVLLKVLNCLQGARYIEISQKRSDNEEFVFGWFKNRISISH